TLIAMNPTATNPVDAYATSLTAADPTDPGASAAETSPIETNPIETNPIASHRRYDDEACSLLLFLVGRLTRVIAVLIQFSIHGGHALEVVDKPLTVGFLKRQLPTEMAHRRRTLIFGVGGGDLRVDGHQYRCRIGAQRFQRDS